MSKTPTPTLDAIAIELNNGAAPAIATGASIQTLLRQETGAESFEEVNAKIRQRRAELKR